MPSFRLARRVALLTGAGIALVAVGCSDQPAEDSNRALAEKIQKKIAESMVDFETLAIEQKVEPAVVEEVQRNLTAINEYQGEINGKLDSVTVNAIQSFQRTIDCSWFSRLFRMCVKDDGIIGAETRQQLAAAAQAKK